MGTIWNVWNILKSRFFWKFWNILKCSQYFCIFLSYLETSRNVFNNSKWLGVYFRWLLLLFKRANGPPVPAHDIDLPYAPTSARSDSSVYSLLVHLLLLFLVFAHASLTFHFSLQFAIPVCSLLFDFVAC